jgi:hypothetical protein
MDQVIQIVGALLLLSGFAATQFRLLDPQSYPNLILNFFGSLILAILAAIDHQWGFLLLEGVWSLVSLWGLMSKALGREPAVATH